MKYKKLYIYIYTYNSKKSKCLKLYCECLSANAYCVAECKCLECCNNPSNESLRQEALQVHILFLYVSMY